MNAFGQLAAISVIAMTAAGTTWLMKGPPLRELRCDPAILKPDEICLKQLSENTAVVWVDARSRMEWKKNGMPGSILWNLDPNEDMQAFEAELAQRVMDVPRVIVYCGDESCGVSRQVAERIRDLGLGAEVSVLHGGWRALSEAGRVKSSNPDS